MIRIRLIHWNEAEAEERARWLREYGYDVEHEPFTRESMNAMRQDPPDAVVIDLGRIPSHGRDVGVGIRSYKDTRHVPLVFVGGQTAKVEQVRQLLPDAEYAPWESIDDALDRAVTKPPPDPVVPASTMAGYSGTPLPKKLGIGEGAVVALVNAPAGFEEALGELPPGVQVRRDLAGDPDVTLWFTRSRRELRQGISAMGAYAGKGGLWIAWPKKASGVKSDLSQPVVRQMGLAAGLVDFKVAAIDATWSGLRFTQRKEPS